MKNGRYTEPPSFLREPSDAEKLWLERQNSKLDEAREKRLRAVYWLAAAAIAATFALFAIFNNVIYPWYSHNSSTKSVTVEAKETWRRDLEDGRIAVYVTTEPIGEKGPRREEVIFITNRGESPKAGHSATFRLTYEAIFIRYWLDVKMHRPGATQYKLRKHEGPF